MIVGGAVIVGLALIAFTYWQFVLPPAPAVTSSVSVEASAPTSAATPAPPPSAPPPPAVESSPPPPAPAAKGDDTPKPPVAEPPRPARERAVRPSASPKPAREERRATSQSTTESVPEPSMVTPGPMPDASRTPRTEERASTEARSVTQAAPEARPPDRWSEMSRELAACEQKGALTKVFCVDRVRWRYCADNWNKVPQCVVTKP